MTDIRSLGLLEHYHATRSLLKFDTCVVVAAKYNHAISKDTLFPALAKLIASHAAFGVTLRKDEAFVRLDSVDLHQVVHFSDIGKEQPMQDWFVDILRDGFQDGGPLWRVIVRGQIAVFAYHHAIGDGLSGLAFHRNLLVALVSTNADSQAECVIPVRQDFKLVPPLEELTHAKPSVWPLIKSIVKFYFVPKPLKDRGTWTGKPVPQAPRLDINLRLVRLPSQLTDACKKNKTTVTAVVHLLACYAVARVLATKRAPKITSSIAVSLRPLTGMSKTVLTDHVSVYNKVIRPKEQFRWTDAAKLSAALRNSIPKAPREIGMLHYLFGNYERFFTAHLDRKRKCGIETSNLGKAVFEAGKDDQWAVQDVWFAQCDAAAGAAVKVTVVNENLFIGWSPDGLADGQGDKIVDAFETLVGEIIKK